LRRRLTKLLKNKRKRQQHEFLFCFLFFFKMTTINANEEEINEKASLLIRAQEPRSWWERTRFQVYKIFNGKSKWSKTVDNIMFLIVAVNITAFVISTDKEIRQYAWLLTLFPLIEAGSVGIFTVEFCLRVWASIEKKKYYKRPIYSRLRFLITPMSIIDLASIVPFYVDLFLNWYSRKLSYTVTLRIYRIFRLFKAEKYSRSFHVIGRVLRANRHILFATLFLSIVLLLTHATILYFIMRHDDPQLFGSIPKTLWFSLLQLTGEGGYEGYPYTWPALLLCSVTMVVAIGLFALPVGIIANGFLTEYNKIRYNFISE
jgi:voltage-gated potassium channel